MAQGRYRGFSVPRSQAHLASWHRQAGTTCDELKDLGGWKSRVVVDRYAKFATEHLAAVARIEGAGAGNVVRFPTISPRSAGKVERGKR